MRARPFGPSGPPVPVVGQGTWTMERDPRAAAVAALRRGLDLGLAHVDTAEMYGSGAVEEIVAEAIAGRRDEVFLVSKVLPSNASYQGSIRACEASLRRLRTDRLDGYLLHWRGPHPLAETFRAFDRLLADGKVRAWGVSNFDAADIEDAARLAPPAPGRLVCNQVLYHVEERAIERGVLDACARRGIAVVGYSPFGSGSFPGPRSAAGRALAEVAAARGATARQVALAFLVRHDPLFAIPKAGRVEHVEENAGAGDLALDPAEIARLEAAFPPGRPGPLPVI